MKKYESPTIELRPLQTKAFLDTSKDATHVDIFDGEFGKTFESLT